MSCRAELATPPVARYAEGVAIESNKLTVAEPVPTRERSGSLPISPSAPAVLPAALKDPVDPARLVHTQLLQGPFWRRVPAYAEIDETEFLDHRWQAG